MQKQLHDLLPAQVNPDEDSLQRLKMIRGEPVEKPARARQPMRTAQDELREAELREAAEKDAAEEALEAGRPDDSGAAATHHAAAAASDSEDDAPGKPDCCWCFGLRTMHNGGAIRCPALQADQCLSRVVGSFSLLCDSSASIANSLAGC